MSMTPIIRIANMGWIHNHNPYIYIYVHIYNYAHKYDTYIYIYIQTPCFDPWHLWLWPNMGDPSSCKSCYNWIYSGASAAERSTMWKPKILQICLNMFLYQCFSISICSQCGSSLLWIYLWFHKKHSCWTYIVKNTCIYNLQQNWNKHIPTWVFPVFWDVHGMDTVLLALPHDSTVELG